MTDAFNALERDLRAAVRARRRRRLPSAPVLGALVVLTLGGGGAVAATQIGSDPHVERDGAALAGRAVAAVAGLPACRPARERIANTGPVLPAIKRALPALRGRAMTVAAADGIQVRVRVRNGPGLIARADPGGCLQARRAEVRELSAGRPVEVRNAAERAIVRMRDTAPGLQMLSFDVRLPRGQGGFGVSFRLRPGDAVPTGAIARSGHLILEIADSGGVYVTRRTSASGRGTSRP
jgi:hypothetical protein